MKKLLDDDETKYLDPTKNPTIRRPTEDDPHPEEKSDKSKPKNVSKTDDLANRIKIVFPKKSEILVDDGISLGVQASGDVEIIKPAKGKQGWDRTPLEKGSPEDLATIKDFVGKKSQDPNIDPETNPAIPDYSE